jgi:hypothetical protein
MPSSIELKPEVEERLVAKPWRRACPWKPTGRN